MSRAFVKDDDDRPERPIARPVESDRPNYVTPEGFKQLQAALERARAEGDERNAEYLEARITSAIPIDPSAQPADEVAIGSTVVVHDERGATVRLHIVGEDEADPSHGTISWISPYAQALLGHHKGERVVVQRPAGPATVVIDAIERLS
jgi:transcription elongation factor GreB